MSLLPDRAVVLLVEVDRDVRTLFAEWLMVAGFRVEQAHNGLQALERAFDLHPDAIVTDLNIPGIDGYAHCRDCIKAKRSREGRFVLHEGILRPRSQAEAG